MAFWSKWFAPTCDGCGEKIVGEPVLDGEKKLCASCHEAAVEKRRAEVEARRAEEEAVRRKIEEARLFGKDPRSRG